MAEEVYGDVPLWALVSKEDVHLVASAAELAGLAEYVDLERVHPYGAFHYEGDVGFIAPLARKGHSLLEATNDALRSLDAGDIIGIDDGIRGSLFSDLQRALRPRELVSAAQDVLEARRLKDENERESLRRANQIAENAIYSACGRAGVGTTERELATWIQQDILREGGRPALHVASIGARSALPESWPGRERLEKGDVVRFDVGCTVDGYHADIARTATCGPPLDWVQNAYGALAAGEQAAMKLARPGVRTSELFRATLECVRDNGIQGYERSHCGHGIGLDVYEPPLVAADVDRVLEEGMTLCLETPFYVLGRGGLQVEDAVEITSGGSNRLGVAPRDLIEIGA
jgi:Xaa-Pro aminopeptidase